MKFKDYLRSLIGDEVVVLTSTSLEVVEGVFEDYTKKDSMLNGIILKDVGWIDMCSITHILQSDSIDRDALMNIEPSVEYIRERE
jgi:hypothetical protein